MKFLFLPYYYIVTAASIAGNGTGSQTLTTDSDADFELHAILVSTSLDSASVFNSVSVKITNKSASYQWSNDYVDQTTFAGGFKNAFVFQEQRPVIIPKQSAFAFDFTNLSGSSMIPKVTFKGYKVFPINQ